jgi:hypothetical protein
MKKKLEYKTNLWMASFIDVILLLVCLFVLIYASLSQEDIKGQTEDGKDAADQASTIENVLQEQSAIEIFQNNFGANRVPSKKYKIKSIYNILQYSEMAQYEKDQSITIKYNESDDLLEININTEACNSKTIEQKMQEVIKHLSKNIFHFVDAKIYIIYNASIGIEKISSDNLRDSILQNSYCAKLIKNEFILSSIEQKVNMIINTKFDKSSSVNKFQILIK